MRRLRVLALVHRELVPPENTSEIDTTRVPWRTEFDVTVTMEGIGHQVRCLGVESDLGVIRNAIEEWKPHVAFNLMESFDGVAVYDQNVVSYLELLRVRYTGCNPRGLILARDKAISKKLLSYHRIGVPDFAVFRVGRRIRRPRALAFPLIVKSLTMEASVGISQASIVEDDERLAERVTFIHERIGTDAIVEQYIEGREMCVGVLGNHRLQVLPVWELNFEGMPDESWRIATASVKWNDDYQKRHGIMTNAARDLPAGKAEQIQRVCKRVYRILGLNGYARIDLRLDASGKIYVLEANPNPQLAYGEDFAESAESAGISYHTLLQRILSLGLSWQPDRFG